LPFQNISAYPVQEIPFFPPQSNPFQSNNNLIEAQNHPNHQNYTCNLSNHINQIQQECSCTQSNNVILEQSHQNCSCEQANNATVDQNHQKCACNQQIDLVKKKKHERRNSSGIGASILAGAITGGIVNFKIKF